MDKHILFIQGGGDDAYSFDQDLVNALTNEFDSSWHVHYPAMPNEREPVYEEWKKEIEQRLRSFNKPAILVGHSIGASVILKLLCDDPKIFPRAVFVVATPYWHDDDFWFWPEVTLSPNAGSTIPAEIPLFLYQAKDDNTVPVAHFHELTKILPYATGRLFHTGGHQCEEHANVIARDIEEIFSSVIR